MLNTIFDNIVNSLVVLFLFTLIPALILKLIESRRNKISKNIIKSFKKDVDLVLNSQNPDFESLNSLIETCREKSVSLYKKLKLNKKNLFEINEAVNDYVYFIRLKHLDHLFGGNRELIEIRNALFSENKVTQREVYHLLNEIKNAKSVTAEEKPALINHITEKCINENNIIENNKLIENIQEDPYAGVKRIFKYALLLLPAAIILSYFIYRNSIKPDVTFGAVIYIDENTFTKTFSRIEDYIAKETGKNVSFEYYSFGNVKDLTEDLRSGKLQGVILNPGTYLELFENQKEVLNKYEVFLRHLEDGKENYKSVIITNKNRFEKYCGDISLPVSFFEGGLNDSSKYFLKHYIQSGLFGFVHSYSMSGFHLPERYLWYEFGINVNSQDTSQDGLKFDFTGDHDKSIMDVYNNEYNCTATYENRLANIGITDIYDKVQILYRSPDIPYNSYLLSRSLDSNLKAGVKNAFLKLNKDKSETALAVKNNKMRITGWESCTDDQYMKLLEPCFNILNTRLPKLQVVFSNVSSDNDFKDRLTDIMHILINKMKKINAWDVRSQSKETKGMPTVYVSLKSYSDELKDKHVKLITGYVKGSSGDLGNFEFPVDSLKGDKDRIIRAIVDKIIGYIELKTTIKYDYQGLFINLGEEDGIKFCSLVLQGGEVIPKELYTVDNQKTVFKKSDKQSIEKYRNKQVVVKYDFENALKLY